MNTILLTCLIIVAVIVVAYLIYMAVGMLLFSLGTKKDDAERIIIEIRPTKKKKRSPKKKIEKWLVEYGSLAARHFAAWSLAREAKLTAVSGAMGHSSIETTQVYDKIVDRINEYLARYLSALMGEWVSTLSISNKLLAIWLKYHNQ